MPAAFEAGAIRLRASLCESMAPRLNPLNYEYSGLASAARDEMLFSVGAIPTPRFAPTTRNLDAYVTRYDPRFPGRPDPQYSIDTSSFPLGTTTSGGGVRNKSVFWQQWSKYHPSSISPANRFRIDELGVAPRIDATWTRAFPEHSSHLNDVLIHHHSSFGQYAFPVPGKTHVGSGGPWHAP